MVEHKVGLGDEAGGLFAGVKGGEFVPFLEEGLYLFKAEESRGLGESAGAATRGEEV